MKVTEEVILEIAVIVLKLSSFSLLSKILMMKIVFPGF
jgi:hypothetical protein